MVVPATQFSPWNNHGSCRLLRNAGTTIPRLQNTLKDQKRDGIRRTATEKVATALYADYQCIEASQVAQVGYDVVGASDVNQRRDQFEAVIQGPVAGGNLASQT